ncbi:MAG: hypothetical protein HYU87_05515 [Chloroflexi bacterium]|nr:hypothetical protein [Chloroflexota bacterium]
MAGAQRLDARPGLTLVPGGTAWVLVVLLAAAGALELVLLRLLYRVGLFIPRDGPLLDGYRVATFAGSFAFDAASVLAVALVVLVALRARARPVTSGLLVGAAALAVAASVLPDVRDAVRAMLAGTVVAAGIALVVPVIRDRDRGAIDRAGVALATLVVVIAQAAALVGALAATLPVALPAVLVPMSRLAEGTAIAAAIAMCAAVVRVSRPGPAALAFAAAGGGILAAALALWPYLTGIVLLWATGISLVFPAPAYPIALAALLLAAATSARRHPERSLGLVLLVVAGVIPQSTTHVLVAVVALALLSAGATVPAAPRRER